eukprot:2125355-Amphidinium_carterae.1
MACGKLLGQALELEHMHFQMLDLSAQPKFGFFFRSNSPGIKKLTSIRAHSRKQNSLGQVPA